jgi:hypothetical protein
MLIVYPHRRLQGRSNFLLAANFRRRSRLSSFTLRRAARRPGYLRVQTHHAREEECENLHPTRRAMQWLGLWRCMGLGLAGRTDRAGRTGRPGVTLRSPHRQRALEPCSGRMTCFKGFVAQLSTRGPSSVWNELYFNETSHAAGIGPGANQHQHCVDTG